MATRKAPQEMIDAQVIRLALSYTGFVEARGYLSSFRPRDGRMVRRAVLQAAILAYTRPFSGNKDHTYATAAFPLSIKKIASPAEYQLHEQLMALRNTTLAHADYKTAHVHERRPGQLHSARFLEAHHFFDLLDEPIDRELFRALCWKLSSACIAGIAARQ